MKRLLLLILLILFGNNIIPQLKWDYPIRPGSLEWKNFTTHQQMIDACLIPDDILKKMTTVELLKAWESFPLKLDIIAFNTPQLGFEMQKNISSALKILLIRKDAGEVVLKRYKEAKAVEKLIFSKQYPEISINDYWMLKILLSQPEIISKINKVDDKNFIEKELESVKSLKKVESSLSIYTPRGTYVPNTVRSDGADDPWQPWVFDVTGTDQYFCNAYPQATFIDHSTRTYNCHAYAWANGYTNRTWINTPSDDIYFQEPTGDGSYDNVSEAVCTKISYTNDHSAIASGTTNYYYSKWGAAPLMYHRKDYTPGYGYANQFFCRSVDVPQDQSTIQSAVNAAASGQTINISYGSYTGNNVQVNKNNLTINGGSSSFTGNITAVNSNYFNLNSLNFNNNGTNSSLYLSGCNNYNISSCSFNNCYDAFSTYLSSGYMYSFFYYSTYHPETAIELESSDGYLVDESEIQNYYLGIEVYDSWYYIEFVNFCGNIYDVGTDPSSYVQAGGNIWSGDPYVTTFGNVGGITHDDPTCMQKRNAIENLAKTNIVNDPGYDDFVKFSAMYSNLQKKIHTENKNVEKINIENYASDYDSAAEQLKSFINSHPTSAFAKTSLNLISLIYQRLNDYKNLESYLQNLINNKELFLLNGLAKLHMINCFNHKNDYTSAIALADNIISSNVADADLICKVLYSKGLMNEYSIDNKDEAIKNFSNIINNYPDEPLVKYAKRQLTTLGIDVKENKGQEAISLRKELSYSINNYPNPFNPTTVINYSLPENEKVEIKVYDILGREIAELVNEFKTAGQYSVEFNGSNLASGIYFYRIEAGKFAQTKKLVLAK